MSPTDPTTPPTVVSVHVDEEPAAQTAPESTPTDTTPAPELLTVEQHAEGKQIPAWLFAAARAHHNWPQGRELTEAAFTAALEQTKGIRIGGPATQEKK